MFSHPSPSLKDLSDAPVVRHISDKTDIVWQATMADWREWQSLLLHFLPRLIKGSSKPFLTSSPSPLQQKLLPSWEIVLLMARGTDLFSLLKIIIKHAIVFLHAVFVFIYRAGRYRTFG
jgi:hypothetical protein